MTTDYKKQVCYIEHFEHVLIYSVYLVSQISTKTGKRTGQFISPFIAISTGPGAGYGPIHLMISIAIYASIHFTCSLTAGICGSQDSTQARVSTVP